MTIHTDKSANTYWAEVYESIDLASLGVPRDEFLGAPAKTLRTLHSRLGYSDWARRMKISPTKILDTLSPTTIPVECEGAKEAGIAAHNHHDANVRKFRGH